MLDAGDSYAIGRLIQFALRADTHATTESEYRVLINRYRNDTIFRATVKAVLDGLGLRALQADDFGLILIPESDSIFALKLSDYRYNPTPQQRMIDGLIQIAIMVTLFPRPQDLDDDSIFARPPISINEVDETLRRICERMEIVARDQPDLLDSMRKAGLYDAWRSYAELPITKETKKNYVSPKSAHGMIMHGLDFLHRQGCFTLDQRSGTIRYRPTHRYQKMVQEFAASHIAAVVRELMI